jgi:hypothetical protein
MAKGKSITLKGAAAGAFIRAKMGRPAETDDERALRVATVVHMFMGVNPQIAVSLIKTVAREGLEAAAQDCTVTPDGRKEEAKLYMPEDELCGVCGMPYGEHLLESYPPKRLDCTGFSCSTDHTAKGTTCALRYWANDDGVRG